jgi:parvulin-like peptidyl-prolyl isomerase
MWNSLIYEMYKDRLTIDENEVNEQIKLIGNKKIFNEYLISEIIIKPVAKELVDEELEKIKQKIKLEGFEKTAMSTSISKTSLNGGNLGWVSESSIAEKFRSKITSTSVGDLSEPIFLPEGIVIFKINNKRKSEKNLNLDDIRKQILKVEKGKLLNMYSLSHYDNLRRSITINYY